MTTVLLAPGFWLGSWAWEAVTPQLLAAGLEPWAVTLPGLAERAGDGPDVTAEDQVADVVRQLDGLREVILVGHSGAGPVVLAAAERSGGRVAGVVCVDSGPMPDGAAHIDLHSPERQQRIRAQIAEHAGWYPTPVPLRETGASTVGLGPQTMEMIRSRETPQPGGTVTGTIRRGPHDVGLPKCSVTCSYTAVQLAGLAADGLPGFQEMAGPDWSIRELPTGHWPMFSEPAALGALLAEIAVQLRRPSRTPR